MTDPQIAKIAAGMDDRQKAAVLEGRVHDCPYNHPAGTRCPNCSAWPFKKGGAAEFVQSVAAYLKEQANAE
jgi:hypothetical protein